MNDELYVILVYIGLEFARDLWKQRFDRYNSSYGMTTVKNDDSDFIFGTCKNNGCF